MAAGSPYSATLLNMDALPNAGAEQAAAALRGAQSAPVGFFTPGVPTDTRKSGEAHRGGVWHAHGTRVPDVRDPFVLRRADEATARLRKPSSVRRAFGRPGVSRRGWRCAQAARACEINAYTVFALLQLVIISYGSDEKGPGRTPEKARFRRSEIALKSKNPVRDPVRQQKAH